MHDCYISSNLQTCEGPRAVCLQCMLRPTATEYLSVVSVMGVVSSYYSSILHCNCFSTVRVIAS